MIFHNTLFLNLNLFDFESGQWSFDLHNMMAEGDSASMGPSLPSQNARARCVMC